MYSNICQHGEFKGEGIQAHLNNTSKQTNAESHHLEKFYDGQAVQFK